MNLVPSSLDQPDRRPARSADTIGVPIPPGLRVDASVWETLAVTGADALIIGEGLSVSRALAFLWPTLRKPVFCCEGRRPLVPVGSEGTLVIESAHDLAPADQQRVLDWRARGGSRSRILAIATRQLLTLVEAEAYNRSLYDRLKTVTLVLP